MSDYAQSRPMKGSSLLEAFHDFTAVDLETTGLSPDYDDIIELGAVRYRNGEAVDRCEYLVNPGYEIDEFIIELTGITNEMLQAAPSIWEVLPAFMQFVGDDVIVGHNVNFDVNFLYDNCENIGLDAPSNDFVDTMRIARRLHKDWKNHRLDTMIAELDLGSRSLHRGAADAELAAEGYLQMIADEGFEAAMVTAKHNLRVSDITAREGFINEDSPLFGKVCVFTGTLESFTRQEAMQMVADIGGICADGVTKKTNLLVLGNNDYCSTIKDGKSNKQKKAEQLILKGADLQIVPESVFLEMLHTEQ